MLGGNAEKPGAGAAIRGSPPLLSRSGADYSRDHAGTACLAQVLRKRQNSEGFLRLSSSAVMEYSNCPFSWLMKRALRLENEPSGMGFFNDMLAGEMAHALIRELYAEIAADGPFDPAKAPGYRNAIPRLARKVLADFSTRQGPFLEPMFEAYLPLLADRMNRLLAAESVFAGWLPGSFEIEGAREYPRIRVRLEGRADRIASSGNSLAIIDYKKKNVPKKADLTLRKAGAESSDGWQGSDTEEDEDEDGEYSGLDMADPRPDASSSGPEEQEADPDASSSGPEEQEADPDAFSSGILGDCQIAAYVRLFENDSRQVLRAAFYSIENAEWSGVIGEGGLKSREAYEEELGVFDAQLARVADSMRSGDFRMASPKAGRKPGSGEKSCEKCEWRAVCRSRFATE
jgi:hypothetical protein